jgi:hypothetical protein
VPIFPTQRLPIFLARLTALVLAFGTCQLATAGIAGDRGRHTHFGRAAGNRLSASRSGAFGCELAVRDGLQSGDMLSRCRDDGASSSSCFHAFLLSDASSPLLPPSGSAGSLAALPMAAAPAAPFVPAFFGRGPPRC